MTAPLYLALVIHNHQPVGQFDFVNEHAVHTAYEPLLDLLERHPSVACAIHFTGSLLDYLVAQQRPLLERCVPWWRADNWKCSPAVTTSHCWPPCPMPTRSGRSPS